MGSLSGLRNRLTIRPQGERYILRFTEAADRKEMMESGPWFFGKTVFALAEYDGRSDAAAVPIVSVLVWVEVFGLPPDLMTKQALYMVGSTLGRIITHDNPRLLNGSKAKVRIDHQISDLVKQAFPPMRFEFGEGADLTVTMLTFKYERTCGFCRVCGLLEHKAGGCQGPPNMSAAAGEQGYGSRVIPNPNPSSSSSIVNPFLASGFVLSKPGMVAAALTASLQRRPNPVPIVTPQAPVLVSQAKSLPFVLSGKKRSAASLMLEDQGKHPKGMVVVESEEHPTLGPVLELSLPHLAGSLIVSPPKKCKVGRPLGSLNKKKEEVIHPWQLEAKAQTKSSKSKKRSFGSAKRTLNLGEEDSVSITPRASIDTAPEDMTVETSEDAGTTPSM
ncbi:hypothetical protein ACLB2K_010503 [Fragaria x ananassa]